MAIILRLDHVMADRKVLLNELTDQVSISNANLSNLKREKVKAIQFSVLDKICEVLDCQPSDTLGYQRTEEQQIQIRRGKSTMSSSRHLRMYVSRGYYT